MKLPLRLVREQVKTASQSLDDRDIISALENSGIEVEEIIENSFDTNVIVVKIISIENHPNADRLRLLEVTDGSTNYKVVCGADNVCTDRKAVLARAGARLPTGIVVKKSKIRGVESEGMLCSEEELGIGEDHSGILLLDDVHSLGEPYATGRVVDIKTASNRSDLNSVYGIVQELDAHLPTEFVLNLRDTDIDNIKKPAPKDLIEKSRISSLCSAMYAATYRLPETTISTPANIKIALTEAGINLVEPIVDITNYLTLITGQPMHAFDAGKIHGAIGVREANTDEKIKLLNKKTITLSKDDLVLYDEKVAIDLAGVMGGTETSVDKNTTEILLTIANFNPSSIRKSAVNHGLRTEASARYERGLPDEYIFLAIKEFDKLVAGLGFEKNREEFHGSISSKAQQIRLDSEKMSRFLGFKISAQDTRERLQRLSIVAEADSAILKVTIPWWRPDIAAEQDLFEEVLKLVGLDNIASVIPDAQFGIDPSTSIEKWNRIQQIRAIAVGAGLFEVNNYNFISAKDYENDLKLSPAPALLNPLSREQAYIRESLLPSLLKNLSTNRKHSTAPHHGVFEISNVHASDKTSNTEVNETLRIGAMTKSESDGFSWAKGVYDAIVAMVPNAEIKPVASPDSRLSKNAQGEIHLSDNKIGVMGLVSDSILAPMKLAGSSVGYFELDLSAIVYSMKSIQAKPEHQFQSATRSLTFEISKKALWQDLKMFVKDLGFNCDVTYQNDYLDKDRRYLTLDVEFWHPKKTLTGDEAEELELKLIQKITARFDAKLKS